MPTKTGMTPSPLTILAPERGKTTPQTKKNITEGISFIIPFHQHLSNIVCGVVFLLFLT
jgi:hypothetical protein